MSKQVVYLLRPIRDRDVGVTIPAGHRCDVIHRNTDTTLDLTAVVNGYICMVWAWPEEVSTEPPQHPDAVERSMKQR